MSGADVETVKSIDLDIWTPEQMDVSTCLRLHLVSACRTRTSLRSGVIAVQKD